LRDVKEGCGAVLSVVDGVVNSADETMNLFSCGVLRSEAELMSAMFNQRKEPVEQELLKDFGCNW
jgi:hypothetical protein